MKTVRGLYGEWLVDLPKIHNDQDITEKCNMLTLQSPIKLGPSTRKMEGRLQFADYPIHAYESVKYLPLVFIQCVTKV